MGEVRPISLHIPVCSVGPKARPEGPFFKEGRAKGVGAVSPQLFTHPSSNRWMAQHPYWMALWNQSLDWRAVPDSAWPAAATMMFFSPAYSPYSPLPTHSLTPCEELKCLYRANPPQTPARVSQSPELHGAKTDRPGREQPWSGRWRRSCSPRPLSSCSGWACGLIYTAGLEPVGG